MNAPASKRPEKNCDWRSELAAAYRDIAALLERLNLPPELAKPAKDAVEQFSLVAPESYVRRMKIGDPNDPLLRQILPSATETHRAAGTNPDQNTEAPDQDRGRTVEAEFVEDPVGDLDAMRAPGLLHKYHGRALLVATGSCAVNCRYCFRRHFPYEDVPRGRRAWQPAMETLRRDPSIQEIILSGGDPLVLTEQSLDALLEDLEAIPHLRRLRIHSRLPIVLPSRIDDSLLRRLNASRFAVWMVVHANHANELVADAAESLARLVDAGIPVLNQTVLLRGINDDLETLVALSERLVDLRVQPYYLHQLDPVMGAEHFRVEPTRGLELIDGLTRRLPGFAVPKYVQECAGQSSKSAIL